SRARPRSCDRAPIPASSPSCRTSATTATRAPPTSPRETPDVGPAAAVQELGWYALRFVDQLGKLTVFAAQILRALASPPVRVRVFVQAVFDVGVLSLIIICVSGTAVGMVLSLQGYNTLVRFGAEQSLGAVVGLSLIRELGPVLTALLATGRAGSATAA